MAPSPFLQRAFGALAALAACARATVSVGRIFSDGMVLQDHATYDQRPFIYGDAAPAELVTVVRQQPNGANDTFLATADSNGAWIVQCDPDYFAADQNNLTFYVSGSASASTIVIRNAAYGDVFLCVSAKRARASAHGSSSACSAPRSQGYLLLLRRGRKHL